MELMGEQKRN